MAIKSFHTAVTVATPSTFRIKVSYEAKNVERIDHSFYYCGTIDRSGRTCPILRLRIPIGVVGLSDRHRGWSEIWKYIQRTYSGTKLTWYTMWNIYVQATATQQLGDCRLNLPRSVVNANQRWISRLFVAAGWQPTFGICLSKDMFRMKLSRFEVAIVLLSRVEWLLVMDFCGVTHYPTRTELVFTVTLPFVCKSHKLVRVDHKKTSSGRLFAPHDIPSRIN